MLVRAPVAETGRSYRLDACANFSDWIPIATKTATGGQVTFSVTMPPHHAFLPHHGGVTGAKQVQSSRLGG
jgi:hypothetical protein